MSISISQYFVNIVSISYRDWNADIESWLLQALTRQLRAAVAESRSADGLPVNLDDETTGTGRTSTKEQKINNDANNDVRADDLRPWAALGIWSWGGVNRDKDQGTGGNNFFVCAGPNVNFIHLCVHRKKRIAGYRGRALVGGQGAETFLAFGHSVESANLPAFLIFGNAKKSQMSVLPYKNYV